MEVIEHLAEEGIPICATINVSVSQAIAVAESYARSKKKALAAGVKPPLCIVVQQVGRLDDYLRDVAQRISTARIKKRTAARTSLEAAFSWEGFLAIMRNVCIFIRVFPMDEL